MTPLYEMLESAKKAARKLALVSSEQKNAALKAVADALEKNADSILTANAKDVESAKKSLSPVMLDRLCLTRERIGSMAQGIREVAALPDPVGKSLGKTERPNGLHIEKIRVPLGVLAIIYESRPNVTSDAAALCVKSGNACVLKVGKEAYLSSMEIVRIIRAALKDAGLDQNCVCMPDDCSRETAHEIMTAVGYVDALIPRGGAGLIRHCVENAKVPCIETGTGICHIYVDKDADTAKALAITENAKTSRPSVCNAAEVLLVHEQIAPSFLPLLGKRLTDEREKKGLAPVQLRVDSHAAKFVSGVSAGENDFDTEFLDYILAVKVVPSVDEAIAHIAAHSTHHSEAIVTECAETAEKFLRETDSAAVYHNASTRFTDGGEFGKGCEIGISTQKVHARGPMGLEELTSYKYIVRGDGQIR